MSFRQLAFNELSIPRSGIYDNMGFGDAQADNETARLTETMLGEASLFVCPSYEYIILDGHHDSQKIWLESAGGTIEFDAGRIICSQLKNAERYVVFVATVGTGYDEWIAGVEKHDDVLQGFVADCIGSQIVESTADFMELQLQAELDLIGMKRTNRFSPGYCGWHVNSQPYLFSLFPEDKPCGISLTDSCLMLPIKSVSGIIGIGTDVRYQQYSCNICSMKMCYKRKKK